MTALRTKRNTSVQKQTINNLEDGDVVHFAQRSNNGDAIQNPNNTHCAQQSNVSSPTQNRNNIQFNARANMNQEAHTDEWMNANMFGNASYGPVMSNTFSFADIENSISTFTGENNQRIERWLTEFEQTALLFR